MFAFWIYVFWYGGEKTRPHDFMVTLFVQMLLEHHETMSQTEGLTDPLPV